jgi:hypothetical protein
MRKYANVDKDEDSRLTSSVNALSALSGLTGVGILGASATSKSSEGKRLGGTLTGVSLGSATAYHLARALKARKALRLAAWLAGGIGGGILGNNVAGQTYYDDSPTKVDITSIPRSVKLDIRDAIKDGLKYNTINVRNVSND